MLACEFRSDHLPHFVGEDRQGDLLAVRLTSDERLGEARGLSVHFLVMDWATMQDDMRGVAELIDSGRVKMPEVAVYPLERAAEAIVAMKAGGVRGKIGVSIAALD